MNEELQKQIANTLQAAVAAAQKGGEWLAGQIPDVLKQLLIWTVSVGVINIVVMTVIWSIWYKLVLKTFKYARSDGGDEDYFMPAFIFEGIFLIGYAIFTACVHIDYIGSGLKALIAPKLFLLEYISHMVKG